MQKLPRTLEDLSGPLYSIEIDTNGVECDDYGQWANYGLITSGGNTLDELLDNAIVDVVDQDGGELDVVPADSNWMVSLIETEFAKISTKVLGK